ncbi:MAG: hypothetical protein HOI95_10725 [Chromatiales bacterium]|jgi:hypothetical protein|nr:hypothetical protein [Chromatiales bacterium]
MSTAQTLVNLGLERANESNQPYWDPEFYRLKGLAVARTDPAAGRVHLCTALAKAQAQQSLIFELRAAMGMANVFPSDHDTVQVLETTYAKMNGGPEFEDVRQARDLIQTVSAS